MKAGWIFVLLIAVMPARAQKVIPAFGNISRQEYELKQVPFDKEAEAVIIHDYAESNFDSEYQLITTRRIRLKILKESALDRANIEIPYYAENEFEYIKEIEGFTATVGDAGIPKIYKLEKSGIFRQKKNDRISIVKMAMPQVKVGSIIEYSYVSVMKHYGGLNEWSFQSDIPTLLSHYNLIIRPNLEFAYRVIKSPHLNIAVRSEPREGQVIFEMRDIAGLRAEPFMDAMDDYRNRIVFQLSEYMTSYGTMKKYATTWEQLSNELLEGAYFGRLINKNLNGADDLIKAARAKDNEYERMLMVYNYVRKGFNWDGRYRAFAVDGLKKVWEDKRGHSAELNLMLINLLKEVKLETYPLLVSHRHLGLVVVTYPFENQFNNVLAKVKANGRTYYLDATDPVTPPDYIPYYYINTNGFVVQRNAVAPTLLEDTIHIQKNLIGVKSVIDANGKIEGELSCRSFDYSRIDRLDDLREMKEDKFIIHHFASEVDDLKIDSIRIENKNNDSLPLLQYFHFSSMATPNGEYLIANLNKFFGFEQNPFVSENRFTNIHFGTRVNNQLTHVIIIPENFKPEELPKNINLVMPDKSLSFLRSVNYDPNTKTVGIRLKLEINQAIFAPEKYPSVSQFFKKMVDLLNEPLVLKKK